MKRWFYAVVGLQLLFIVGEAASYQVKLVSGREVLLRVVPMDPRSLFTGHYADLTYDISRMDVHQIPGGKATLGRLKFGDTVFAGMRPGKPYAHLVELRREMPATPDPGLVYIRGRVIFVFPDSVGIDYGLERYYIPETKEEEVNRMAWGPGRPEITVAASVDRNGTAMIRRVLVNGKPLAY